MKSMTRPAVARPAGRMAKERRPVRRRSVRAWVLRRQAHVVAGVGEGVAEAEDAGVARAAGRSTGSNVDDREERHRQEKS